jgi:hypothetical protein
MVQVSNGLHDGDKQPRTKRCHGVFSLRGALPPEGLMIFYKETRTQWGKNQLKSNAHDQLMSTKRGGVKIKKQLKASHYHDFLD